MDIASQLKVANGARKGRKQVGGLFSGCKGEKYDKGVTDAPAPIVNLVALGAIGISGFCMFAVAGVSVSVAGGCLCLFSPYMIYQKRILKDLGTFRTLLNDMRQKINEFQIENMKLTSNVSELGVHVAELEEIEDQLATLANTSNIDRLVEVVTEMRKINQQIKKNTQSEIVQHLITTVLRTDRDGDLQVGPRELKLLMFRLHAQPGFDFKKDRFLEVLEFREAESVPIEKIMRVIRNLKDENCRHEDNIFVIHTSEQLASSKI
mmetsp:Transcript_21308/g.31126  ORF Transcript_21308/g.31126 Transcript_21308/m.31126 type:complete len:264 (+) Transcript_21308:88-879(+)